MIPALRRWLRRHHLVQWHCPTCGRNVRTLGQARASTTLWCFHKDNPYWTGKPPAVMHEINQEDY